MIEEALMDYGILGIWTIFNITTILYYRKKDDQKDLMMQNVVKNNTIALTRFVDMTKKCEVKI